MPKVVITGDIEDEYLYVVWDPDGPVTIGSHERRITSVDTKWVDRIFISVSQDQWIGIAKLIEENIDDTQ